MRRFGGRPVLSAVARCLLMLLCVLEGHEIPPSLPTPSVSIPHVALPVPAWEGPAVLLAGAGDFVPARDLIAERASADVVVKGALTFDLVLPGATAKYTQSTVSGWTRGVGEGPPHVVAISDRSALLLPVFTPEAQLLRLALKHAGSSRVRVFWNARLLADLTLPRDEIFHEYSFAVPPAWSILGENNLTFVADGFGYAPGDKRSTFALSHLTLGPRENAGDPVVSPVVPFDSRSGELTLHPGTTLHYHLIVPRDSKLVFAARSTCANAKARLSVRSTTEGGSTRTLFDSVVTQKEKKVEVTTAELSGRATRFSVRAGTGSCSVALSELQLLKQVKYAAEPTSVPVRNVILIVADTLRADRVRAVNPAARVSTPAIDRLARSGVVFDRAHTNSNWTLPSVVSLLTSRVPSLHGVRTRVDRPSASIKLISERLQDAGLRTALFAANGFVSANYGLQRGWDDYVNYADTHTLASAHTVFSDASRWLTDHAHERFFLYVHTFDSHVPYAPPAAQLARLDPGAMPEGSLIDDKVDAVLLNRLRLNSLQIDERSKQRLVALYDAEIAYHDSEMGKFLDHLDELGLADDTLVVFTSDHGEELDDHGSYGHEHSSYEELLHVPLIVHHPKLNASVRQNHAAVSLIDVAPTLIDALGLPAARADQGSSLIPLMSGGASARPFAALSSFYSEVHALAYGPYKLVTYLGERAAFDSLYDLSMDEGELLPLAPASHPIATRTGHVLLGTLLSGRSLDPVLAGWRATVGNASAYDLAPAQREQLKQLGYVH